MSISEALLPDLAAAAIAFTIITYVILDGTDLGVGILFATRHDPDEKQIMVNSILPIWDGNETWLVLGGGGLLALFPMVYGVLFSALYIPVIAMLLALITRAVALEFRADASARMKRWLDINLVTGSLIATLCQGVIMGSVIQGIDQQDGKFAGDGWEWLSAFPLACGAVLVVGYALLGSCWLYWRTEGTLQTAARRQARMLGWLTLTGIATILAWTSLLAPFYREHLLLSNLSLKLLLIQCALLVGFHRAFSSRFHFLPLFAVLGWFGTAFIAAIIALYPLILPPSLTISQASAPASSQGFMLIGFAVLVPVTLAYNTWGFWVFRGKVKAEPAHD
ncbi:cytochrome d ubiquinol oxidase subunit II [Pseudomonas sp. NFACC13-1]|uniref:cytochrome d ubiquinol oxidase subunit II n=1 Tax=Pseudomonas sp. NFACC13-1 TaxID=1566245 RepID=UPI000886EA30|nr:cytochrome d ubiquinol oxidase subunit II [Pseudomonas sp. NFACC13-1]SDB39519.1 cytochrome bd-I ubiquinol oxidase subunit 2 apoprotein [Pseudomonas sp. NFACC13-1]